MNGWLGLIGGKRGSDAPVPARADAVPTRADVVPTRPAAGPTAAKKPSTKADLPMSAALMLVAARTGETVANARKPVIEAARTGRLVVFGNSWPNAASWSPIPSTYWTVAGIKLAQCMISGSDDVCSERKSSAEPDFRPYYRLRVDTHQLEMLWPPLKAKKA